MSLSEDRKKLIEYLPPFMQDFLEIQQIMGAQQAEMDTLDENITCVLDNSFLEDCDEVALKTYEKRVGVTSVSGDTLDIRKTRVQMRWNDFIPYTYATLIQRLNTFFGAQHYEIKEDLQNYELTVYVRLKSSTQIQELEELLDKMMPENMHYSLAVLYNRYSKYSRWIYEEMEAYTYDELCAAELERGNTQ
jgi:hypothetical protein